MIIDCDECVMNGTSACDDCVVSCLVERIGHQVVEIDAAEERVVQLFQQEGLVPPLRLTRRAG